MSPSVALFDAEAAEPRVDARRLVVIGTQRFAGHVLPTAGAIRIGRDPSCEIVIDEPEVAPFHAQLDCGALRLEDLGTPGGTWVRGVRLRPGQPVALRYDEVVQLGGVALLVQRALAPPPPVYQLPPPPANLEAPAAAQMSAAMQRLYQVVERVATGNISVLVLGETGVGKELLAEAIHRRSVRAAGPLVRLNCAALSETLLESELFGYEKGAFTGALASKPGLLESADGGTVFLDEIGELPLATQVKLLRVIESREVMRVGALRPRPIDVRFVAATHRDLEARIDEGAFREDLYFRLAGITVRIPPLRERVDEIETLAKYFAARFATDLGRPCPRFAPDALARLLGHTWPGNIRELRNCIERAVLLCQDDRIGADEIVLAPRRTRVRGEPTRAEPPDLPARPGSSALDREQIVSALARAAGNQKVAAQLLGVSRRTLLNKLDRFGISRPRKRRDE